nr:hypothetical protein BaRGS_002622 [Batillaria attramentaria]
MQWVRPKDKFDILESGVIILSNLIDVNVSYILGSTNVEWNITITDVNAAPQFEYPTYYTTVAENVTVGTTVAVVRNQNDAVSNFTGDVIIMSDPDTVTDNFKIKSLIYNSDFNDTFKSLTYAAHAEGNYSEYAN